MNYLRNIALRRATTPYVLSLDVDFAVSPNLRTSLDKAVDAIQLSRDVSLETRRRHHRSPYCFAFGICARSRVPGRPGLYENMSLQLG